MTTTATATIANINAKMKFTISLTDGLEPTSPSDGYIYVVSNGKVVKANTQEAAKQYHNDGAVSIEGLYYEDGTSPLSPEDAKDLDGRKFKLTITGGSANADGQLRIAAATTAGDETHATRVVNADTVIGYIIIHANGASAATYTYKDRGDDNSSLSSFFYAYSPVHMEAAGSSGSIDTAGEKTLAVTCTLEEITE